MATVECAGPGAPRLVGEQVALVALVAERPDLGGRVAVREQVVCERLDVAERVAGRRIRRVVVAVEQDHRRPLDAARAAEADHRRAERGVEDLREAGRERRPGRGNGRGGQDEGGEQDCKSGEAAHQVGPPVGSRIRKSSSATQTGISPPSRSAVAVIVAWRPPSTSSTATTSDDRADAASAGTGAGNRTRSTRRS